MEEFMRKPLIALGCLLLGVTLSAQQSEKKPQSDEGKPQLKDRVEQDHAPQHRERIEDLDLSPAQREVAKASERLREAILNQDADQLREMMAINYQVIGSGGRSVDRTDSINAIVFEATDFEVVDTDILNIKAEGDAAAETGHAYIRGSFRGELFSTTYRYVRHWQRENGQWMLVTTNIQGLGGVF
jgi:ketosteroid isomerase-like protein